MDIPSGKGLNTANEYTRVNAQEIFEGSGCDIRQHLVTCDTAHELLDDDPSCLWIFPDQVLQVIHGRRRISVLTAQRHRLRMVNVSDEKPLVLIHGLATSVVTA
jgi:hypothetical protein